MITSKTHRVDPKTAEPTSIAARAPGVCALALLVLLMAGGALAQDCDVADEAVWTPPAIDGKPVSVEVGILLIDLLDASGADESFAVDSVLVLGWRDPRLSAAARGTSMEKCRLEPSEIWTPVVRPMNQIGVTRELIGGALVDSSGFVTYRERIFGTFSAVMDLRGFPFDRQRLLMRFVSYEYGPEVIDFVVNDSWTGRLETTDLAGWTLLDNETDVDQPPLKAATGRRVIFDHWISIERQPAFAILQMVVPLCFIVLMAWSVFWLDPQAYATQIGVATASVFSLIAFLLSLRQLLPRVGYLTRLDELTLSAMVLVFLALGQAVLTGRLAQRHREELANRLDSYGRWIYITAFVVLLVVTMGR